MGMAWHLDTLDVVTNCQVFKHEKIQEQFSSELIHAKQIWFELVDYWAVTVTFQLVCTVLWDQPHLPHVRNRFPASTCSLLHVVVHNA